MEIDPKPPGLLSRRMRRDGERVVVEEEWNIDTPGCPLIRNPWASPSCQSAPFVLRRIEMTEQEFDDSKVVLFG